MHDVFHVSMLRKYIPDPNLVIENEPLKIQEWLMYKEEPIQILNWKEQVLRTKTIPFVKVLWHNHRVEEAFWEVEQDMKNHYPHLFDDTSCMIDLP